MKNKNCHNLTCNLYDKYNYVAHIRTLNQKLTLVLILKKVYKVIQFNQKAWLKPYIDMNTKLRTEAKIYFEKFFFELMNKTVFGKTMKNVTKHRDINLIIINKRRNYLVSYKKMVFRKFTSNRNVQIKVKMNRSVCLGISMLEVSKTLLNKSINTIQNYDT